MNLKTFSFVVAVLTVYICTNAYIAIHGTRNNRSDIAVYGVIGMTEAAFYLTVYMLWMRTPDHYGYKIVFSFVIYISILVNGIAYDLGVVPRFALVSACSYRLSTIVLAICLCIAAYNS